MEIRIDENWKQENGKYKCPYCLREYSRKGICTHIWRAHDEKGKHHVEKIKDVFKNVVGVDGRTGWARSMKGKTYEEIFGKEKSDEIKNKIRNNENTKSFLGKHHSEETRKVISDKMKVAHAEGRAWNIGKSRWNNEPSYPEKFVMEVIANEFIDKQYKRELPFSKYSLDFAWEHKKRVIEIDGEQHEREDYKKRDEQKDKLLVESGWKVMRIKWKDMYKDTKTWIEKMKEFIGE